MSNPADRDLPSRFRASTLYASLAQDLRAGRWGEGERLPAERDLSAEYGVARNTLRRALDELARDGLVQRHVGRGTFCLVSPAHAELADASDLPLSPSDVMECRLILEPEMIALAVLRATGSDIARVTECLKGTDAAVDLAAFEQWDAALHDAFAQATHNGAMIVMSRTLARVRERMDWGRLKARGDTLEHRASLQRQHHAMVEAVRQRDRDAARNAMREHILYVQSYMFG